MAICIKCLLRRISSATIHDMEDASIVVERVNIAAYAAALETLEAVLEPSVSFLQSPLYGRLQEQDNKTVVYFVAHKNKVIVACGLAVRYTAPLGMNFLYCPYGPVAQNWSPQLFSAIQAFFKPIVRELDCAFVRLDAELLAEQSGIKATSDRLARTASLQPRAEWLLDITGSKDDLWTGFHKHARYNVRLAERAGAVMKVFEPKAAPLDEFFSLMQTTGGRDGFSIFDKSYYQAYLSAMTSDDGFMTVCYIDEKPVAAGLFVIHDHQIHYVFAGSSDVYRKIAPAYSIIWSAIQAGQQRDCRVLNFGGVVDHVKGQNLAGVTGFKRRFGGYQADHQNPVDMVYDQARYMLFRMYKILR